MEVEKKTNQMHTYKANENGFFGSAFVQEDSEYINVSVTKSSSIEDNNPFRTVLNSMKREEVIFVRDFLNSLPL